MVSFVKYINIQDIGEIGIYRNKRNKRLCLSVNKNKVVRVSIPFRTSFQDGEKFLIEKLDWVKKTMQKIEQTEHIRIFNEQTEFSTRQRKLKLLPENDSKFKLLLNTNEIQIRYPVNIDLESKTSQFEIKKLLFHALKDEAVNYFPARVAELALQFHFKYNRVKIRNSKTRWGSCSYDNNINLSIYLLLIPEFLSDYVILHELTHTLHKNHGQKFWESLEKVSGDAKGKALLLKKIKIEYIS